MFAVQQSVAKLGNTTSEKAVSIEAELAKRTVTTSLF
jgi:hypothetical protein